MQTNTPTILLTQVSIEDLEHLIKSTVKDAIKGTQTTRNEPEELLTQKEAAKFLKCTVAHLIDQRRNGNIKCAFLGSHPRYKRSELLKMVSST